MTSTPNAGRYQCFADVAAAQVEGHDFQILVEPRPASNVAVVAPHGGKIEAFTSAVARDIAGSDLNLYLFEGIRQGDNYLALHLTSHRFNEPRCLALLAKCRYVLTVHGCGDEEDAVLLGGRDSELRDAVQAALVASKIAVRSTGHKFPASNPLNICNRGMTGEGVQMELPLRMRQSAGVRAALAKSVRLALLATN